MFRTSPRRALLLAGVLSSSVVAFVACDRGARTPTETNAGIAPVHVPSLSPPSPECNACNDTCDFNRTAAETSCLGDHADCIFQKTHDDGVLTDVERELCRAQRDACLASAAAVWRSCLDACEAGPCAPPSGGGGGVIDPPDDIGHMQQNP